MPSCFAKSLDFLVHLPKAARQSEGMEALRETQASNIPREFMRVVDHLMTHPLTSRLDELFVASSSPDLLFQIREVGFLSSSVNNSQTRYDQIGSGHWR